MKTWSTNRASAVTPTPRIGKTRSSTTSASMTARPVTRKKTRPKTTTPVNAPTATSSTTGQKHGSITRASRIVSRATHRKTPSTIQASASTCHITDNWSTITYTHLQQSVCTDCHTKDQPDIHYVENCDQCHTTEDWSEVTFDHTGYTDCTVVPHARQPLCKPVFQLSHHIELG